MPFVRYLLHSGRSGIPNDGMTSEPLQLVSLSMLLTNKVSTPSGWDNRTHSTTIGPPMSQLAKPRRRMQPLLTLPVSLVPPVAGAINESCVSTPSHACPVTPSRLVMSPVLMGPLGDFTMVTRTVRVGSNSTVPNLTIDVKCIALPTLTYVVFEGNYTRLTFPNFEEIDYLGEHWRPSKFNAKQGQKWPHFHSVFMVSTPFTKPRKTQENKLTK